MKVWITKYALSGGVTVEDAEYNSTWCAGKETVDKTYAKVKKYWSNLYRIGTDAHLTEAAALTRVAAMVGAKRRSLAKQQATLAKIAESVEAGRLPMAKEKSK